MYDVWLLFLSCAWMPGCYVDSAAATPRVAYLLYPLSSRDSGESRSFRGINEQRSAASTVAIS